MDLQKMNPTIKALWVQALRSGEYTQGCRVLRRSDNTFCCLGVLEDILRPQTEQEWQVVGDEYLIGGEFGSLTPKTQALAHLTGQPQVQHANGSWGYESLANLKDGGLSLSSIADIIEEQL